MIFPTLPNTHKHILIFSEARKSHPSHSTRSPSTMQCKIIVIAQYASLVAASDVAATATCLSFQQHIMFQSNVTDVKAQDCANPDSDNWPQQFCKNGMLDALKLLGQHDASLDGCAESVCKCINGLKDAPKTGDALQSGSLGDVSNGDLEKAKCKILGSTVVTNEDNAEGSMDVFTEGASCKSDPKGLKEGKGIKAMCSNGYGDVVGHSEDTCYDFVCDCFEHLHKDDVSADSASSFGVLATLTATCLIL